ncbi:hypothetical protein BSG1_03140 [Bacillus sp. SG-1]|nr:hypothetical protein BSG1_03140 [Bacillus sp. SG-1]
MLFFIVYPFKNKKIVMPLMAFYAIILIFSFTIIPNEQGTGVFLNSVRSSALILIVLSTLIWYRNKTEEVKTSG